MKLQLEVPNMACGSCAKSITSAVKAVDQNAKVEADPKTKKVEVETESSEDDIKAAIKGAGYAVS
ncbi:MAG: heavy-metal-associated domain-containing protein [Cyanobacteria bacterium J06627_28]|jgi:copper chaperone